MFNNISLNLCFTLNCAKFLNTPFNGHDFGERMLLYSQFLNSNRQKDKLQHDLLINKWLHTLQSPNGLQLFEMKEIYQRLWNSFQTSIIEFCQKNWIKNINNSQQQQTLFIERLDAQTLFFIQTVLSMIELKTRKSPLPFIPFDFPEKQGGVSIQAYLCYENERHPFQTPLHSALGQHKKTHFVPENIIQNSMFFCQDEEHRQLVTLRFKQNEFHGEESWMGQFGKALISELQNQLYLIDNINQSQTKEFDRFWVLNFTHPSRLEFVLNTAPCSDCRALFKSLRAKLNEIGIYIPILIHALYPCQSGEESEVSPIQVLDFDGRLILTKIFTKTSYNQLERAGQSLFIHADLNTTEMFFSKSYGLLSACQKHILDGINLDFIFQPLADFIRTKKLTKADVGTIFGWLKSLPAGFKNKMFYECINLLKHKHYSNSLSALHANQIDQLFANLINTLNEKPLDNPKNIRKKHARGPSHEI